MSTTARAAATPAPLAAPQLFGVHPAELGQTTLPGGHFNYALVAGQHVVDGVVVENLSGRVLTFEVYGADMITAIGGGLAPAQPTAVKHSVGAWITVAEPKVTIAAHGQFTDQFTVAVPAIITPGQHLGAIVVAADVGSTSQGTPIEARAALITVVTVPGIAVAAATLSPLRASTASPGDVTFGITLFNSGNVLLTYTAVINIVNGDGARIALMLTPSDSYVVPSGRAPLAAMWKDTAALSGQYRAQATVSVLADGRLVRKLSSQWLVLDLSSGVPLPAVVGTTLALLIILVIAIRVARRGMRGRRSRRDWSVPRAARVDGSR